MNKRAILGLSVASALLAPALMARASVGVELTLSINTEEMTWEVYATVVDPYNETLGLHGFNLDVIGLGSMAVDESFLEAPMPSELNLGTGKRFDKGFVINAQQGDQGMGVGASQSSRNRLSIAGTGRNSILEGVGKFAFTEPNQDFDPTQVPHPVILASGFYMGNAGGLTVVSSASRFTVLPKTLPAATEAGAPFTPVQPAYVLGHTLIPAGGAANVDSFRVARLTVDGAATVPASSAGGGTSVVKRLDISSTGKLDLNDNALIVDYDTSSPTSGIGAQIARAYADGAWNGKGLTSKTADANGYGVGYGEASKILGPAGGRFAGQKVDETAVLVRRARYGDANLNGSVTIADFGALRSSFGQGGKGWSDGDFDYNGSINIQDFGKLRANFGVSLTGTASLQAALADAPRSGALAPAPLPADQVKLVVNVLTGAARITGTASDPAELTGYEIISASGALMPAEFQALEDQGYSGWTKFIVSDKHIAEGNLTSFAAVGVTGIGIGNIYDSGAKQDLMFNWVDERGVSFAGIVEYVSVPEPAVFSIAATAGALGLARRRRRCVSCPG